MPSNGVLEARDGAGRQHGYDVMCARVGCASGQNAVAVVIWRSLDWAGVGRALHGEACARRDWVAIYDECSRILYQEIDYRQEGNNADRFRENFKDTPVRFAASDARVVLLLSMVRVACGELSRGGPHDTPREAPQMPACALRQSPRPSWLLVRGEGLGEEGTIASSPCAQWVTVPRVLWEYTTPQVMVMEYKPGIKINRKKELVKEGIDEKQIARLAVESYLIQILRCPPRALPPAVPPASTCTPASFMRFRPLHCKQWPPSA